MLAISILKTSLDTDIVHKKNSRYGNDTNIKSKKFNFTNFHKKSTKSKKSKFIKVNSFRINFFTLKTSSTFIYL